MENLASPAPVAPVPGNAKIIRDFLDAGSSRKVETGEYMNFWKGCTVAERAQFGDEIFRLTH